MERYLVLDVETGGVDSQTTSLLTGHFSVYDETFHLLDELYLEVKPTDEVYHVTASALKVNNINLVEHNLHALTYTEAAAKLLNFLYVWSMHGEVKLNVVGHNPNFDLGFVFEHLVSKADWEQNVSYRLRDTASIGNFLKDAGVIPSNVSISLGSLAKHFNVNQVNAHTASDDVKVTIEVYQEMLYKIRSLAK